MTRAVLHGLLGIHLTEARRSARKVGSYLSWALLLAITLAGQHFTGVGAANPEARPPNHESGLLILALICLGAVTAGLGGPVWLVRPREAHWVVTAPGGARALVAWHTLRSVGSRLVNVVLLVTLTQATRGDDLNLWVALVLAVWYAGYGLVNRGVRYGFAALFARSPSHWLARLASAALFAGGLTLLSSMPAVTQAVGRVASGGDTGALLSAGAWLLVGLMTAAFGVSHAEVLVTRAIAEGDLARRKARRGWLESRRRTAEPESFRLIGAGAFGWTYLLQRRRQRWQQLLMSCTVVAVAALLARYQREWTPAVAGVLAFFLLLTAAAVRLPAPAVADGRLLPLCLRRVAAWKILTTAAASASGFLPAWLFTVAARAGDPELLLVGSMCILPFLLLVGVLNWERIPEMESQAARFRRLGARATATVGVSAAFAWWLPGIPGALLAAGWLVLGSLLITWFGLRRLELTLRPARLSSTG